MNLSIKLVAAGALAICALVVVWRGGAAAATVAGCSASAGYVVQFCVNVPSGQATRRETTIPLNAVATARTDLRVEAGIPASEILRIATGLDGAVERVERVFGRPFSERPRVLLFATSASFARGTEEVFDYSRETALLAARSYGGIVDQETLTIAVNWRAVGRDLDGLLAHELVHVMIRSLAGPDAHLPAWFEEGFAANIQREDALPSDTDALAAQSLLSSGVVTLSQLATLPDWHRTFVRVGRPQYAVVALAVRGMEARVGQQGLVTALVAVGAGASFEDAYAQLGSGDLAAFVTSFDEATGGPTNAQVAVTKTNAATGDLAWTLYGFVPNSLVRVHISGVTSGYDLAFMVTTDDLGIFRGSFGSTAAAGAYTIEATSGALRASAALVTTR